MPIKKGLRNPVIKNILSTPLGLVLKFFVHIKKTDRGRAIEKWISRGQPESGMFEAFHKTASFVALPRECQIVLGIVMAGVDIRSSDECLITDEIASVFAKYNHSGTVAPSRELENYVNNCQRAPKNQLITGAPEPFEKML
jgi:hypothetical protein